jgi:group II intron reverse transcriptase/maturase
MDDNKSFKIGKNEVMTAYRLVKENRGAAGVDGVSLSEFEENLKDNLYKIWNRMSSGSYFPPPVKAVDIPKKNGGTRTLGVPTVADRIAQTVVKQRIEPLLEPLFHPDSYGYRPNKSALDAVGKARERCWKYDYVVEFDIKGLFDNISHELLMKAVETHVGEPWILLYIRRWLTAPFQKADGTIVARTAGTPQGGVVSPILANLFMHYAFDMWMVREHAGDPFERYADDAVIHCPTLGEAGNVLATLDARFREVGLELHPDKTRIVYCKDAKRKGEYDNTSFDFLGYTFKSMYVKGNYKMFDGFVPSAGKKAQKAFRDKIKRMKLHRKTTLTLNELAREINPTVRGWLNYYTAFQRSAVAYTMRCLNDRLIRWAMRKFKSLKGKFLRARDLLRMVAVKDPKMFAHWDAGWTI